MASRERSIAQLPTRHSYSASKLQLYNWRWQLSRYRGPEGAYFVVTRWRIHLRTPSDSTAWRARRDKIAPVCAELWIVQRTGHTVSSERFRPSACRTDGWCSRG